MNWQLLIPLLTTTFIAVAGWLVGHALHAHRDRRNKRREIRVKYLIEAYRHLESGACRGAIHGTEFAGPFESAIADIQLWGTTDQSQMAKNLAVAIANRHQGASAGPLLLSLRNALREELDLGSLNEAPFHFRLSAEGQVQAQED